MEQAGTRSGRAGSPGRTRKLPVPDVTGLSRKIAEKVLASAGFLPPKVHFVESYEQADTLVAQMPERGTLWDVDKPVTIHVTRVSWVRHLPSVYRPKRAEDPSFLRDYLWIFQQVLDSVSRKIDSVPELFNPGTTPPEFLAWLASWFAISFDESMPEAHRRRILREAPMLFRMRGTRPAIVRLVKLFSGLDVEIEENRWPYRGFRIGVASTIGLDTMILPEISMSQTFVVRIPMAFEEVGEDLLLRLHKVIEAEKPAHSNYFLQFTGVEGVTEYEGMRVGVSSQIGIGMTVDEATDKGDPY
jgi:phage tail-like protein